MAKSTKCLGILLVFCIPACASAPTVRFETKAKAVISVVEWDQLDRQGKQIGETPTEIEVDEIKDKVLKITAAGKQPQFWIFAEPKGQKFEAQLELLDIPESAGGITQTTGGGSASGDKSGAKKDAADLNETHRLLMRSYQSLASGDLAAAKDLAEKLGTLEPRLAAPQIIMGLAALQSGNQEAARLAFNKAKSLDPKDSDIDKLLQAVQ